MFDIKHMPLLSAVTLGVLVTGAAAWQGTQLFQQWQTPLPDHSGQTAGQGQQVSPAMEMALEDLTLFGIPGEEDAEPELVATEDLPETNLRLVLRGVFAGTGDQRHSAMVEGPDKKTDLYIIGDTLPGNAALHSVHARRIVIERGGALETLHFPEQDEISVSRSSTTSSSRNVRPVATEPRSSTRTGGRDDSAQQEEVRARLDALRERLRN